MCKMDSSLCQVVKCSVSGEAQQQLHIMQLLLTQKGEAGPPGDARLSGATGGSLLLTGGLSEVAG